MQTEVKITISVITTIGYLSGAFKMHFDSSHFYKIHSSGQNSGTFKDFKV